MGIKTVMITGDNPLTAAAIAAEAGVDDFMAEATPEDKLKLIRTEQAGGRMVAMTGDGTNDAPALAQADVGVAMNTGTMAAKEAGNMVDLDSNPTKLIEIVEIGKQLLMTRGALTTFSIANDVAKYFAIIPAMFILAFPQLSALNVMQLATPQSAILSAVVFNALIIIALIPLALRGITYKPLGAAAILRRNQESADLRSGGRDPAVRGYQDHRRPARGGGPGVARLSVGPGGCDASDWCADRSLFARCPGGRHHVVAAGQSAKPAGDHGVPSHRACSCTYSQSASFDGRPGPLADGAPARAAARKAAPVGPAIGPAWPPRYASAKR
jgi:hypothetical protein